MLLQVAVQDIGHLPYFASPYIPPFDLKIRLAASSG
jgi:hypothetical protein